MTLRTKTRTLVYSITWKRPLFRGFDDGVESSVISLELSMDAWVDMGCPGAITVTIEPGDLLNEDQS